MKSCFCWNCYCNGKCNALFRKFVWNCHFSNNFCLCTASCLIIEPCSVRMRGLWLAAQNRFYKERVYWVKGCKYWIRIKSELFFVSEKSKMSRLVQAAVEAVDKKVLWWSVSQNFPVFVQRFLTRGSYYDRWFAIWIWMRK